MMQPQDRAPRLLALLERLPTRRLWPSMVALSLALTEAIVAAMEWLLLGRVTADYLLTGLVAAGLVATVVVGIILNSADRTRRLAARLAENEERYRTISNLTSDLIFSCYRKDGESFCIDWLAGSCEQLFGLGATEMKALGCWRAAVLEEDLPAFDRLITATGPGTVGECELRVRHADGSIHTLHVNAQCLAAAENGGHRLYGSCQDITARKEADRRLQSEHALRQQIIASLPGVFYVFDGAGRFLAWNHNFEAVSGRDAAEIVLAHPLDLIAADDRPRVAKAIETAFASGQATVEASVLTKDGARIPYFFTGVSAELDGQPAVLGVGVDITERRCAEDRLRLAASVFQSSEEGIVITDADNRIVDVNDAFVRISGYSREEVLHRDPGLLRSGHHGPEFFAAMWQAIAHDGHWQGEVWNRRRDGELYAVRLNISSVRDSTGRLAHYVAVLSDITETKQYQERLEKSAQHDALTGIPNRLLLADRMRQAVAQAQRNRTLLAIAYLDLDGFKPINDVYGHEAGDRVLVEVADRLRACLRGGDTVARLGGDEFVLLLLGLERLEECEAALQRVLEAVSLPVAVDGQLLAISASIGVTLYPQDDSPLDVLLRHADQAMYAAKRAGRNCFRFFKVEQEVGRRIAAPAAGVENRGAGAVRARRR